MTRTRTNFDGRSEEYKKGYKSGYTVALEKLRRQEKKEEKQISHLIDISKLRLIKAGVWLHIEGDDETYICPFCETRTYIEGEYMPKYCMECGNMNTVIKEADNDLSV